jgi:hypothetical protein
MGFFARFFGAVPKKERGGICLTDAEPWRVSPTKNVERFIRALPLLVPEDSVAYFEGTGDSHVAKYLRRVSIRVPQVQVAVGTIWPRPDCYHVPLTAKNLSEALQGTSVVTATCIATELCCWSGTMRSPMIRSISRERSAKSRSVCSHEH